MLNAPQQQKKRKTRHSTSRRTNVSQFLETDEMGRLRSLSTFKSEPVKSPDGGAGPRALVHCGTLWCTEGFYVNCVAVRSQVL